MRADFQKLILLGHATRDAEIIESKSGNTFTKFGLAVNRYLGKEKGEEVTFYDCVVFGDKLAEKAHGEIKKGDLVTLDGRPQAEAYINKDGEAKSTLSVVVNGWKALKA